MILTSDTGAPLRSVEHITEFVFGGNAKFTLKSLRTGAHHTYKMLKPDDQRDKPVFFAWARSGGDEAYIYMGMVYHEQPSVLIRTKKSTLPATDDRYVAFDYFLRSVVGKNTIHPSLEVWHEGKCARCARPLTHPESIERGIGPECWNKMKL